MRRWRELLLGLVLLVPPASAAPATLTLSSGAPVALDGHVEVVTTGGAARVVDDHARGAFELRNATGQLRVYTARTLDSRTSPRVVQTLPGTLDVEEYDVKGADLVFALRDERFELRAESREGGALAVGGDLARAGAPRRLDASAPTDLATPAPSFGPPEDVPATWERGWLFVGAYAYGAMPLPGFPAPAGNAEISILGGVHLYAAGGTLAFTDASGEAHALRTGNWSDDPATVTRRDVFFEGTLGSASIPAGPRWGIGAPGASWRFDGEIAWTDATGEARANGTTKSFSHEDVRARGSLLVEPDPAALGSEARYRASGDVQTLTIGGAPLVAPRGAPTAALVGASLLALAAALAGGLALYTRLAAADLLAHPQRARICRAAEIEPGIHLRELHRRAGGGWGAFRAHLHLLRRGGHLRVERRGRYALVFPARVAPQAAIPHPLARAVYDALPDDGSPLPLVALRERVGTTRQLLNYHAGRLEAAGLITLTRSPRGRRAARARLSTPSIRTTGT